MDRPSLRTVALTLATFALSTLDAIFTFAHLENGGSELNLLMDQVIRSGFQAVMIVKSLGIGLIAYFLAAHHNFKTSFYGLNVSAAIYVVLPVYHVACVYLYQVV